MTSIEPGFYKEKEWGIRTESVYVCKSVDVSSVSSTVLPESSLWQHVGV